MLMEVCWRVFLMNARMFSTSCVYFMVKIRVLIGMVYNTRGCKSKLGIQWINGQYYRKNTYVGLRVLNLTYTRYIYIYIYGYLFICFFRYLFISNIFGYIYTHISYIYMYIMYINPIPLILTPPTWSQIYVDRLLNHGFWAVFNVRGIGITTFPKAIQWLAGRHMGAHETPWSRAHDPKPGAMEWWFRSGMVRCHESGWVHIYIYIYTWATDKISRKLK